VGGGEEKSCGEVPEGIVLPSDVDIAMGLTTDQPHRRLPFKLRAKSDQYVRKAYVTRDYCVLNPRDPQTRDCDIDKTHHYTQTARELTSQSNKG
jgi:hypothetical protein